MGCLRLMGGYMYQTPRLTHEADTLMPRVAMRSRRCKEGVSSTIVT